MFFPMLGYYQLPLDPSLVFWFDASNINGRGAALPSDGDLISYGSDLSGWNGTLVATGTARPTFKTNIINGLPVARFNGTSNYLGMLNAFASSAFASTGGVSLFNVFKPSALTGTELIFFFSNGNGSTSKVNFFVNSTPNYNIGVRNADGIGSVPSGTPTTSSFVYTSAVWQASTTSAFIRVNGTQVGSNSSYSTTSNTTSTGSNWIGIGGNSFTPTSFFPGDIAESIAYRRVLSSTEIVSVETYLKNKYAL